MSLDDHMKSLRNKHANLERVLEEETSRPLPNSSILHDIKCQKLAIKDELEKLAHP